MGFKRWLRGIYHHAGLLQSNINEYICRINRHLVVENIFDHLFDRIMKAQPYPPYKALAIN